MQEAAKNLLLVLVALLPIVDPLGGSPFFLALTREYSPEARKALAWRIAMNSFFLLIGSYFVGTYVLAFLGISLPVVQVGGGLIVIATGWTLLKQRDDEKHDVHRTVQPQDTFHQAFYPLTMPMTVGPGSISVAITLGANARSPSPVPCFDNFGCSRWIGVDRDQHFPVLWICRPVGANAGSDGDDGDHTIVVVFPGLYRCADCLERDQSIAGVAHAAFCLTERAFRLEFLNSMADRCQDSWGSPTSFCTKKAGILVSGLIDYEMVAGSDLN